MLKRLRERAGSESGFTLIELLVVMLILGILAAIAIPAFLNQKDKANDSSAKSMARTMQTAMETCNTDNGGTYAGCDLTALNKIEPTITSGNGLTVNNPSGQTQSAYTVSATASTGTLYSIARSSGTFTRACSATGSPAKGGPGTGGCPSNGSW